MKVAFVVQAFGREVVGGGEAACREIARRLAPRADLTVLTTCAADSRTWANALPAGEAMEDGVRVIRHPSIGPRHPRFDALSARVFRTADPPRALQEKWVRRQGPESPALLDGVRGRAVEFDLWVFFTYLYYPTIFGLPPVAARAVLHPFLHDEAPARLPLLREVMRAPAGLAFATPEEWQLMLRTAGWPRGRMRVIGLGVEEGDGDVGAFREAFSLESDPYLLYLGRVDRGKGTDLLCKWFAAFKAGNPGPLRLVVAGPVVHRPPPHPDVVVTGRLAEEQRWAALEGCEVFVHPSPLESFGFVLLEAWSKGRPALVNANSEVTGGHARRARAGLPFRDAAEFAAGLEVLLGDPAAARRLGENGRAYAEDFAWDRVIDRYEAFLHEVADAVR